MSSAGRSPGPGRHEESYDHWSRLHDGLDPRGSAWVAGWVRLTHACARPLARRGVHPDAVTATGVVVTALVPLAAAGGGAWPLVAVVPLVVAAVLDGVDGALAARTGTASARGRVLDALADRCSDLLMLAALALLGAPAALVVALAGLTLLHEYARASAQAAGMRGPGAVTVWERPSRVLVVAFTAASVAAERAARAVDVTWLPTADEAALATAGTVVGLALAAVGLGHVLVAVRRSLPR